ncbi:4-(cytidine 5'-diphospho)-2-C-methyl-D-erythritol kinase [Cytophagaceae bacterium YF14B1]|uniref:4-diphosphocytidyl-2-C-methyl-D-erythritol kinase n=1 Tax=Xanthocytophaga flava TaxID=3048013 RepID=A0AAE3QNW3_9BACT|nr:4-(cytidine 5'-diphospho)-2-C-methyl-D-erythritol kinase [Xanthocytophaga flavus]MDJ1480401.1 4-(cytidine 5'-diphospho)-2-C-methyl-D-erythritol kinase [Xanthocytophaga flavus]
MLSFPNAKINLGLHITEKRPDGYHNLESCFYSVGWTDVLEIIEFDKLTFTSSGISIPGNPDSNLCIKAYNALKKDFDLPPVHIHLHKVIPIGAGLGGGSADAAFTIKLLNEKFDLKLSPSQMEDYIRPIGSDCAFFIQNYPRYCYDKGDQFEDISVSLKGYYIVLVYPAIHVSTGEAYAGIKPQKPFMPLKQVLAQPVSTWKDRLVNDFENGVFARYPVLATVKQTLYDKGALYATMSGSGSTVFGIFEKEISVEEIFPSEYLVWSGFLQQ